MLFNFYIAYRVQTYLMRPPLNYDNNISTGTKKKPITFHAIVVVLLHFQMFFPNLSPFIVLRIRQIMSLCFFFW